MYAQGSGEHARGFIFSAGGDYNTTNGGDFQTENSVGRMVFQADRNLVVYRYAPNNNLNTGLGNGVAWASGSSNNSSREYKKNITDLVEIESINIIKNLNPVSFEYKEGYWDETDCCNACDCNVRKGFIWEDTKPILPQACGIIKHQQNSEDHTKMLYKEEIIADLVKVNQYLLSQLETLSQQLSTQATLISDLQSKINIISNN